MNSKKDTSYLNRAADILLTALVKSGKVKSVSRAVKDLKDYNPEEIKKDFNKNKNNVLLSMKKNLLKRQNNKMIILAFTAAALLQLSALHTGCKSTPSSAPSPAKIVPAPPTVDKMLMESDYFRIYQTNVFFNAQNNAQSTAVPFAVTIYNKSKPFTNLNPQNMFSLFPLSGSQYLMLMEYVLKYNLLGLAKKKASNVRYVFEILYNQKKLVFTCSVETALSSLETLALFMNMEDYPRELTLLFDKRISNMK